MVSSGNGSDLCGHPPIAGVKDQHSSEECRFGLVTERTDTNNGAIGGITTLRLERLARVIFHIAKPGGHRYTIVGIEHPFQGHGTASGSTLTTDLLCGQEWKDVLQEILPPQENGAKRSISL